MKRATGRGSFSLRLPRTFRAGLLAQLIAVLLSLNLGGCVAIPVKAPRVRTPTSGTIKGKVDLTFLKEGVTTRAEVREKLQHVAAGYENPNLFVARWLDSEWVFLWFAGAYYSGAVGASRDWGRHTLFISFDEKGLVKRIAAIPDKQLLLTLRSHTAADPAGPEQTFSTKLLHSHIWSMARPGEMVLGKEGVAFREEGKKKHDFRTPLENVKVIAFHGGYNVRLHPEPNEFILSVSFQKKTAAGTFLLFHIDFQALVTLVRVAERQGLPMK